MPFAPLRPLSLLAWTNVILHLSALVVTALSLQSGTPLVPLAERMTYLARAPWGWTLGWSLWMLCAGALVAFVAVVAPQLGECADLARLALLMVVVGAGFDLGCDAVYITVFPWIVSWQPPAENLFLTVEKITGVVSMVVANGFYSTGTLLLTLALRGRPGMAPFTISLGAIVAGFGFLLVAAGFTGVPWHAAWTAVPTICFFCLWVILVARSSECREGIP